MTPLRQTAFKLTDADLALLRAAQDHYALPTRIEALRYILRYWAEREGIELPKPKRGRRKP